MPPPKTEKLREEATTLALRIGVRAAAERLQGKVSKSTLGEWVKGAREARAQGKPPNDPTRSPSIPLSGEPPDDQVPRLGPDRLAQGGSEELPTAPLPPRLGEVDLDALDFDALEKIEGEVGKERQRAREAGDTRQYVQLARLQIEIRAAMAKLRPPPKVDAAADPANLEARAIVLKRIQKMIDNAKVAASPAPP